MLRCQSPDMIAKELILSITGYKLVRAVMNVAAEQNNLDPRRLSFSRSQDVVNAALPGLDAAQSPAEYQTRLKRMIQRVACASCPTAANGHRVRGQCGDTAASIQSVNPSKRRPEHGMPGMRFSSSNKITSGVRLPACPAWRQAANVLEIGRAMWTARIG